MTIRWKASLIFIVSNLFVDMGSIPIEEVYWNKALWLITSFSWMAIEMDTSNQWSFDVQKIYVQQCMIASRYCRNNFYLEYLVFQFDLLLARFEDWKSIQAHFCSLSTVHQIFFSFLYHYDQYYTTMLHMVEMIFSVCLFANFTTYLHVNLQMIWIWVFRNSRFS